MAAMMPRWCRAHAVPSAMAWFASANQTGADRRPRARRRALRRSARPRSMASTIALWGSAALLSRLMRVARARRAHRADQRCARCSAAFASCAATGSSSARCRSTCSRCCSAARRRCCRSSPATSCRPGRGGSACFARRRPIGALTMSVVLARRAADAAGRPGAVQRAAVFGLAVTLFAFSTVLWLSLVALAAMGAADVVSVVIRFSLVQLRHARRNARPGQRGQRPVHRHLEPARRFPGRRHGGAVRRGAGGGDRRPSAPSWSRRIWMFLFPSCGVSVRWTRPRRRRPPRWPEPRP